MRPDRRERQAALVAPGEEADARPGIGTARVGVANVGGEEFDVAPGGQIAGSAISAGTRLVSVCLVRVPD